MHTDLSTLEYFFEYNYIYTVYFKTSPFIFTYINYIKHLKGRSVKQLHSLHIKLYRKNN